MALSTSTWTTAPCRTVANTWEQFTWGAVGAPPAPGGAPPGFSRLVWADEFNGSSINAANWGFDLGGGGWGNNELQNYTSTAEKTHESAPSDVSMVLKGELIYGMAV